jgi:hypothetical protein
MGCGHETQANTEETMLIARWQIDARFGHKDKVLELVHGWERSIGPKVGLDKMKTQLSTGSIGAREATVEMNHSVASLAELEQLFEKLGKQEAHKKWGQDMEPHVVSGSSHWQIFRVL